VAGGKRWLECNGEQRAKMAFRMGMAGTWKAIVTKGQWCLVGKASRWLEGKVHGWQKWMEGNSEWKANLVERKDGWKEMVDGRQRWMEDEGDRGPG
jgi:hypothetical protein